MVAVSGRNTHGHHLPRTPLGNRPFSSFPPFSGCLCIYSALFVLFWPYSSYLHSILALWLCLSILLYLRLGVFYSVLFIYLFYSLSLFYLILFWPYLAPFFQTFDVIYL